MKKMIVMLLLAVFLVGCSSIVYVDMGVVKNFKRQGLVTFVETDKGKFAYSEDVFEKVFSPSIGLTLIVDKSKIKKVEAFN